MVQNNRMIMRSYEITRVCCMMVVHPPGVGEVMGSIIGPNCVIAKDVKMNTYSYYVKCAI